MSIRKIACFKQRWLKPAWFTYRLAIYFALWIVLAMVLAIGSKRQDADGLDRPGLWLEWPERGGAGDLLP